MPKIYFDVFCLNRPFDDQTYRRIRLESEAILLLLEIIEKREAELLNSEAIGLEIDNMTNFVRMMKINVILTKATSFVKIEKTIQTRANKLTEIGLKAMDALHLACAEKANATVLLTVDDKFSKIANEHKELIKIPVVNPIIWIDEVI